jgi:Fe-S-cluster-containing hydrogenase component 2
MLKGWFYRMPKPYIEEEKCFGCMNCVVACPMGVLIEPYIGMIPLIKRPQECTGCKRCEDACPFDALKVLGTNLILFKEGL